jgi:S-formylglutathione hydrolase FrmB
VASTFEGFDFGDTATHQINNGHAQPFIAIFAPLMTNPPRDTECTDIPNGPKAFTWLAEDVRQWAISSLRAADDPKLWSVMGWSTGGFCAAKLVLRAPDKFTNAAALGAYFEPIIDDTTGDLFESDQHLQNENSPFYLYQRGGLAPGSNLLMVSSQADDVSWPMTEKMMTATKGNRSVYTLIYPSGGHNYDTYSQALSPALGWFNKLGAFARQNR